MSSPVVAGLLLAAGSGRRFGGPKALADTGDGPWVLRALDTLHGLPQRIVVVGAAGEQVSALLPTDVRVVGNPDHPAGMGTSLAAGLRALDPDVDAVIVMLVDLPDVPAAAVQRLLSLVTDAASARHLLARACYRGGPGHPVMIGASHVRGVLHASSGDRGARDYLARHAVTEVDCSDLAAGGDVDQSPTG